MNPTEDLLRKICEGFHQATSSGTVEDGGSLLELPLTYLDGSPIEVLVHNGRVSDDGRTLIRLQAKGRVGPFENWPERAAFLREHFMDRIDGDIVFIGRGSVDLVKYIQGLKDMELLVPEGRESTEDFDDLIRGAIRDHLDAGLASGRISEKDYDHIINPRYKLTLEDRGVTIPIRADFRSRDLKELVVILSNGGETTKQREKHIREKLAEHALLHGRQDIRTLPVIPKDSEYGEAEDELFIAFTGQTPMRLDRKNDWKKLYKRLVTMPGRFSG